MWFMVRYQTLKLTSRSYVCWFCGEKISSQLWYYSKSNTWYSDGNIIYLCHNCNKPTYFCDGVQTPWSSYWTDVPWIEDDLVNDIFNEARECYSINAFTGCVMLCRKLLMHVAVSEWASEWLKFVEYVNYLSDNHYTSPNAKDWVDEIRKMGNEINHEIKLAKEKEAKDLIDFVVMLLTLIYDFPSRFNKLEDNDE